jgi:hypothetical protein
MIIKVNSVRCYDFDKYFIIVFFSFGDFVFCLFLFKLKDFAAGADTVRLGVRELPVLVDPSPKSRIEQKYIYFAVIFHNIHLCFEANFSATVYENKSSRQMFPIMLVKLRYCGGLYSR